MTRCRHVAVFEARIRQIRGIAELVPDIAVDQRCGAKISRAFELARVVSGEHLGLVAIEEVRQVMADVDHEGLAIDLVGAHADVTRQLLRDLVTLGIREPVQMLQGWLIHGRGPLIDFLHRRLPVLHQLRRKTMVEKGCRCSSWHVHRVVERNRHRNTRNVP